MVGPTDADARAVLRRFGLPTAAAEPLGNRGGFSGARLWRVGADHGEFCLKAWPPGGMTPERHGAIVRLVNHARQSGLTYVPYVLCDPSELVGRLWDLAAWMPGAADFHADPSPARLRAACVAIARLHRAWEGFAGPPRPCPAVSRRLKAASDWLDLAQSWRPVVPPADPVAALAERVFAVVAEQVPAIPRLLEPWRDVPLAAQPCLCDVWHDHVLFTGDEVTGLIDYGAVKADNVAADLARLLGSFVGDDTALYEQGLDAYAEVRPLGEPERRLVPLLDRTGVVLGLANWLRWLYVDGREFEDRTAVARRMIGLMRRAESCGSGGAPH
jgi:Ser/Thr protein kinase RdoA (MazF antagonist)